MKPLGFALILLFCLPLLSGMEKTDEALYEMERNVPYYPKGEAPTAYAQRRCKLDIYYPKKSKGFPTVVWFHGGGLRQGHKSIPKPLKKRGFAIVSPNYRLFPKSKCPEYIEDAAASVAWTFKNIGKFGGDPAAIFISGHSAGGYLASMVGLDKAYLLRHEIDADEIAGLIPFSGHTITHFTPREERGISKKVVMVDEFAPISHLRKEAPPILLITGDREFEMLGRYEENAYFWRMLKVAGHPDAQLLELGGFDHGGMAIPAFGLLSKFVYKQSRK